MTTEETKDALLRGHKSASALGFQTNMSTEEIKLEGGRRRGREVKSEGVQHSWTDKE